MNFRTPSDDLTTELPGDQSRTQSPQALSSVNGWSQGVSFPRVSIGDQPLAKELEDSGYDIRYASQWTEGGFDSVSSSSYAREVRNIVTS